MLKYGKYWWIGAMLGIFTGSLSAQYGTGVLLNDEAYRAVPAVPDYGSKSTVDTVFEVDLTPYCPRVGNQGFTNTCTGWAVGYGAHTVQKAIQRGWYGRRKDITDNAYSALFIYNQIKEEKENCQDGSYIRDALKLLQTTGDIYEKYFGEGECSTMPTQNQLAIAKNHRIKEYRRLFDLEDPPARKIRRVKESLVNRMPVVICLRVKNGFFGLKNTSWWFPDLDDSPPTGMAHAMTVVGYNDAKGKGGAFRLMNSYGPQWGEDGFIWMSYEDFAEYCSYAFQFSLVQNLEDARVLTAHVGFRTPKKDAQGNYVREGQLPVFEEAPAEVKGSLFQLEGKEWKIGDVFQITVDGLLEELYLYAFSIDSRNNVTVHWPRDEQLDEKFDGSNESAVILTSAPQVVIPTETDALSLELAGREYICLLFSEKPLEAFNERLAEIKASRLPSMPERLEKAFGSRLYPFKDITYLTKPLGFSVAPNEERSIVPLVLRIDVHN